MVGELVCHLLASPGLDKELAAREFVSRLAPGAAARAAAGLPALTKVATKERIPLLAAYSKGRWEPNDAALAAAGLSRADADASRPPPPPKKPRAPKPAPTAATEAAAVGEAAELAEPEAEPMVE